MNHPDITIKNSMFERGFLYWSVGIDIEPNAGDVVDSVTIQKCTFNDNPRAGIDISFERIRKNRRSTIIVEDCDIWSLRTVGNRHGWGIGIGAITDGVSAKCIFRRVHVRGAPYIGYFFTHPFAKDAQIELIDCSHQEVVGMGRFVSSVHAKGFDEPAIIGVDGAQNRKPASRDRPKDGPQPVQSTIIFKNFKILDFDSRRVGDSGRSLPVPPQRDLVASLRCSSGQIWYQGVKVPLNS